MRDRSYVRLPNAGEPTIGTPTPMAHELPIRWQAVEREQAHEIDYGGGRLNDARLSGRADIGNSGSVLAPDDREGHGSHPFPAPGDKPDGAAKGRDLLVDGRHGRRGTD